MTGIELNWCMLNETYHPILPLIWSTLDSWFPITYLSLQPTIKNESVSLRSISFTQINRSTCGSVTNWTFFKQVVAFFLSCWHLLSLLVLLRDFPKGIPSSSLDFHFFTCFCGQEEEEGPASSFWLKMIIFFSFFYSSSHGNYNICSSEWTRDKRDYNICSRRTSSQSHSSNKHWNSLGGSNRVFLVSLWIPCELWK